jgi:hypothetical protein
MNTSDSNNTNNFVNVDTISSINFDNTKPNNKKDSKSRNYKAVKKTEDRDEKVSLLINELPNKLQKQLQSFKTGVGVSTVQKKALNEKTKVGPKTNFACEVRDAILDDTAAFEDAWTEHCKEKHENEEHECEQECEQMDEELNAWLTEERLKVWNAAYEKWIECKEFTDNDDWYALTEDVLKEQYYQLDDIVSQFVTNTRTLAEYETAIKDALLQKEALLQTDNEAIKEAWLRTDNAAINDAKFGVRCAWLNDQFADANTMDSVISMEDSRFVAYMDWLNVNELVDDNRYVTWAQQQYYDAVEIDDSKYDELPLHERYTWDSEEDDEDDDV